MNSYSGTAHQTTSSRLLRIHFIGRSSWWSCDPVQALQETQTKEACWCAHVILTVLLQDATAEHSPGESPLPSKWSRWTITHHPEKMGEAVKRVSSCSNRIMSPSYLGKWEVVDYVFIPIESWCTDVTVIKNMCCPNLEALFINCKPFYSPQEFSFFSGECVHPSWCVCECGFATAGWSDHTRSNITWTLSLSFAEILIKLISPTNSNILAMLF